MLSPQELQLLTAHVDGELSERRRRQLSRLLRRSPEAREMLRLLQGDAHAVRDLPCPPSPDLAAAVLAAIDRTGRVVARKPLPVHTPAPANLKFPAWSGLVAAAGVLLLVGTSSFLTHLTSVPEKSPENEVARQDEVKDGKKDPAGPVVKLPPEKDPEEEAPPVVPAPPERPERPLPLEEDDDIEMPVLPGTKPLTPPRLPGPVLTSPGNDGGGKFERVALSLPTIHRLHDLVSAAAQKNLLDQLSRSSAVRVEILARDATRGFERVRDALAAQKITLLLDPYAQARLKRPTWKTDFALFFENAEPESVASALRAAGGPPRPGTVKPGDTPFEGSLVVKDLGRHGRRELFDLLGTDPVRYRPQPAQPATGVDIRRPITDLTTAQVTAALEGKGPPRPGTRNEITGFVQVLNAPRIRSAELKRFLDSRQPARPGTVQVFLVLRNVGP